MYAALAAIISALFNGIKTTVGLAIAIKIIMIGVFTLILPVVLNNVFVSITTKLADLAAANISTFGSGSSFSYTLTGLGAWLADAFQVPAALSIILSAVAMRLTLRALRVI